MLSDSENPQHLELHEPPKTGRWKQSASKCGEDGNGEAVVEADGAIDEDIDTNTDIGKNKCIDLRTFIYLCDSKKIGSIAISF